MMMQRKIIVKIIKIKKIIDNPGVVYNPGAIDPRVIDSLILFMRLS